MGTVVTSVVTYSKYPVPDADNHDLLADLEWHPCARSAVGLVALLVIARNRSFDGHVAE